MNAGHRISALLAVAAFCAIPTQVSAQHLSFSFAKSFGHHGGHHGCHPRGGWYGLSFYSPPPVRYVYPVGPPPVYVYPAPAVHVIQPAPQIQLSQNAASVAPSLAQTPVASNSGASLAARDPSDVTLHNPTANAGSVAFLVQEQVDAELRPGATRTWSDRSSLTVDFDRGGSFGITRKVLQPGNYEFVVTDQGWDLVATVGSTARPSQVQRNALPTRR